MMVYIKNITADRYMIESYLNNVSLNFTLTKDTYIIKNATEEQYTKLIDFSNNLIELDKLIFVKKNL